MSYLHRLNHLSDSTEMDRNANLQLAAVTSAKMVVGVTPDPVKSEFSNFLFEVAGNLPSRESVQRENADLTQAPAAYHQLGPKLGQIADAVDANPELISQALNFYDGCTRREDTLSAVRAVCLWNLRRLTAKLDRPELIDETNFPANVRDLANRLPR